MLTKRMMIQTIARRLKGQAIDIDPKELTEPYRKYWKALDTAAPGSELDTLTTICTEEDLKHIIGINTKPVHYANFAEIEDQIKDVSFFWEKRIPNGKLTVIAGAGGVSKSMLAQQICYFQLHKKSFPDGAPVNEPGRPVLYVDCEGFAPGIKMRVKAWGMNKNKFNLWSVDLEEDGFINFSNQTFRDELIERINAIDPKPALVVIDSFGNAKAGGQDKVEDVRDMLNFLNKVAGSFDIAIVLIAHTRKPPAMLNSKGEVNQDDVRGSSHVVNMARSVIGVWQVQTGPEPDPDAPRIMAVLKANYSRKPQPIGYDIFNDADDNPKIIFREEAPKPYKEPTKIDLCGEWMIEILTEEGKPIQPKELETLAQKAGFKRDAIYEAHRRLEREKRIMDTHGNKHPDNAWKLIK